MPQRPPLDPETCTGRATGPAGNRVKGDMNGGLIMLAKDLAWLGVTTQTWNTDWVRFPAGFQLAQLVVIVKSIVGASLAIQLETTRDTDSASDAGTPVTANAVGTTIINITTGDGANGALEHDRNWNDTIHVLAIPDTEELVIGGLLKSHA